MHEHKQSNTSCRYEHGQNAMWQQSATDAICEGDLYTKETSVQSETTNTSITSVLVYRNINSVLVYIKCKWYASLYHQI